MLAGKPPGLDCTICAGLAARLLYWGTFRRSGTEAGVITLARREFHQFQAAGRRFLYLVTSAAAFELDEIGSAVLAELAHGPQPEDSLVESLSALFTAAEIRSAVVELVTTRAIGYEHQPEEPVARLLPMMPFPL